MKLVYQTLLDIVFPRTSYERWLEHISADFVRKYCPPGSLNGLPLGVRPLFAYKDQHIGAMIHQAKFFRSAACLELIADMVCAAILEDFAASRENSPDIIVTWVPARRRRLRTYGYCQGKLLAELIRAKLRQRGCVASARQFLRRRPKLFDREQKLLSRSKRLARKNPFVLRRQKSAFPMRPIHIWIIDDVATTGFTLDMARETIYRGMPAGAAITIRCLAFAH